MHHILLIFVQCNSKGILEFVEDSQTFQEILSGSLYCIMIIRTSRASSNESKISCAIF
jgi:hypothetical protein